MRVSKSADLNFITLSGRIGRQILGLTLFALFLQQLTWLHTYRSLFIDGQLPLNLWRGLTMSFFLIACVAFALPRLALLARWIRPNGFFLLWCTVFFSGVLFGSLNYIYRNYFIGDLLRFLTPWVVFGFCMIGQRLLVNANDQRFLLVVYRAMIGLAILDACIIVYFGLQVFGVHLSGRFFVLLVPVCFLDKKIPVFLRLLMLVLVGITVYFALKRTTLVISIVLVILSWGVAMLPRGRFVHTIKFLLVGLGGLFVASFLNLEGEINDTLIGERIANIVDIVVHRDLDDSYGYRVAEVGNIREFFRDHPYQSIFGIGFGAEIPMVYNTGQIDRTGTAGMHHVHKGYYLYFLRHGFLGLSLLVWVSFYIIRVGFISVQQGNAAAISLSLFSASHLLAAYAGNLMMEDIDLPLAICMAKGLASFGDRALIPPRNPTVP